MVFVSWNELTAPVRSHLKPAQGICRELRVDGHEVSRALIEAGLRALKPRAVI